MNERYEVRTFTPESFISGEYDPVLIEPHENYPCAREAAERALAAEPKHIATIYFFGTNEQWLAVEDLIRLPSGRIVELL